MEREKKSINDKKPENKMRKVESDPSGKRQTC